MCEYTISHMECGHKIDDKASTQKCPQYAQTGVACDADNLLNRRYVSIRKVDANGICDKCLYEECDDTEATVMQREEERVRKISLAEAKEREEALKAHEERAIRESQEESERIHREQLERACELSLAEIKKEEEELEAGIRQISIESKEEHDHMIQQKEESDIEYATRMSLEAAERARQEEEDLRLAIQNSMMYDFEQGPFNNDEALAAMAAMAATRTADPALASPSPPPAPAAPTLPTQSAAIPSPPLSPPATVGATPTFQRMSSLPLPPKDFSCPPIGDQTIGHYTIGTRRQPILQSQEPQTPTTPTAPTTTHVRREPAPTSRLGGQIAPDVSSQRGPFEQIQVGGDRPSLRPAGGSRRSIPPPTENEMDPKLAAALARQRMRAEEEEEETSNPSSSASDSPVRLSSPATITEKDTNAVHSRTDSAQSTWDFKSIQPSVEPSATPTDNDTVTRDEPEREVVTAKRMQKHEFDEMRKKGWGERTA